MNFFFNKFHRQKPLVRIKHKPFLLSTSLICIASCGLGIQNQVDSPTQEKPVPVQTQKSADAPQIGVLTPRVESGEVKPPGTFNLPTGQMNNKSPETKLPDTVSAATDAKLPDQTPKPKDTTVPQSTPKPEPVVSITPTPSVPPIVIPVPTGSGGLSGKRIVKGNTTRIMAMGDSITAGWGLGGSYRKPLQEQLAAAGYKFEFVGTQTNFSEGMAQPKHEGYPGFQAINASNPDKEKDTMGPGGSYTPNAERQIYGSVISAALAAGKPDVILLMIGVNDMFYPDYLNAKNRTLELSIVIDQIFREMPQVKIIVGSITYRRGSVDVGQIEAVNSQYKVLVDEYQKNSKDVYWAPQAGGNPGGSITESEFDVPDSVHPSSVDSYSRMANGFYNAIAENTENSTAIAPSLNAPMNAKAMPNVALNVSVSHPRSIMSNWKLVTGPAGGNVSFSEMAPQTVAKFSANGKYQVRYTASADGLRSTSDIIVTVTGAP